jgi:hypothetical protein
MTGIADRTDIAVAEVTASTPSPWPLFAPQQ